MATSDRGFASLDLNRRREISSKGGVAAHRQGTAHKWTREEAREAGRKGGMASHRGRSPKASGKAPAKHASGQSWPGVYGTETRLSMAPDDDDQSADAAGGSVLKSDGPTDQGRG